MKEYMIESKNLKGKWESIGLSIKAMNADSANKKVKMLIKREYITPGKYRAKLMK